MTPRHTSFLRAATVATSLLALLLPTSSVEARTFRSAQIPNGSLLSCNSCHTSGGGTPLNPFGATVESSFLAPGNVGSAAVQWGPALAALDSDGDGVTNGAELGDPEGTWRPGSPNPTLTTPTFPGFDSCADVTAARENCTACGGSASRPQKCATQCGDGVVYAEAGESCDGDDFAGESCASLGFTDGSLRCNTDCSIDSSGCSSVADEPGDTDDVGTDTDDVAPDTDDVAPDTDDVAPDTDDVAPDTDDVAPDTDDVAPDTDDVAPDTDDVAPDSDDVAPDSDDVGADTGVTDGGGDATGDASVGDDTAASGDATGGGGKGGDDSGCSAASAGATAPWWIAALLPLLRRRRRA
jgi:uncharacterized protein (TIGR03382 family)